MGFLSQKVVQSDLQAGDHIYSWRTPVYAYAHHGIYIGDNKVVHFTQDQLSSPNSCFTSFSSVPNALETCLDFSYLRQGELRSGVIMSSLNSFLGEKGSLHRYEYGVGGVALVTKFRGGTCTTAKSDLPEEVIHKAKYLLQNGFGKYDVFTNNCEHFALYCKTGLIYGSKGSGGSGQVQSIIGVPASAILSLPFRMFFRNPVVLGAAAVGNYTLGRYTADLGVRSDAVKIKVEELAALRRYSSSVDQEDAGLVGSVTEAEDLAMVSSEEDAWKLESVAAVKVKDLAVSHRNLLSAVQEDAGLFGSATKVEDLAALHCNILSADQEDEGLLASILSNRVGRRELEAGDHIYTWRLPFTHAHHGIYKGEGKVIHSTQHKNPTSSSASKLARFALLIPKAPTPCIDCEALGSRNHTNGVIISCLDCFLGEGSLHRFVYGVSKLDFVTCSDAESDAAEVVIKRAMWFLEGGFGECEDFASYCKTGFLCNK